MSLSSCCGPKDRGGLGWSRNLTNQTLLDVINLLNADETEIHPDGSRATRIIIAVVYSVVCALGVVGNLLVLFLLHSKQRRKMSTVTFFVLNLAVTDFQFVLTLPFWAVDTALDFSWPFGNVMCKIISSVSTMNMYASVFFLTAMSVARYCSVAFSLRVNEGSSRCLAKVISLLIWVFSMVATLPHAVFSTTDVISDEELCLVKFPELRNVDPQFLLGLYQTLKILLGFVIPLIIISVCYLLLLKFLSKLKMSNNNPQRRSKVTKSVTIVVLSFFICWLPNQALTAWGIFIKFNILPFTEAFYTAQAYFFPLTVCLAHTNSCLNPILYCLIRREFREALKELLIKLTPSFFRGHNMQNKAKLRKEQVHVVIPLQEARTNFVLRMKSTS
ncbi:relaxin-3 receptor 1-like [Rhinatrema bivittatum]|uniref:relaxin-3 receptor 1-like n=1 Tax=Rhinatrema bivittatum TaxID=194408 RepID=UPI001128B8A4|nr:relaxin-3 receptor 1-like [Rhinatrema bivittatum]